MSDPQTPEVSAEVSAEVIDKKAIVAALIESEPAFADSVRDYYMSKRTEYAQRITAIDDLLGFIELEAALGTRLERLERHVGMKAV